jgi:hypothetical protein
MTYYLQAITIQHDTSEIAVDMDAFDDCHSLPGSKDPLADPQAEKMWSRCGGAPAIVKWRARFSMSAVDRELHELELD